MSESKYYSKDDPVAIIPLKEYTDEGARVALKSLLESIGVLDYVNKGMHIVINRLLDGFGQRENH